MNIFRVVGQEEELDTDGKGLDGLEEDEDDEEEEDELAESGDTAFAS